LRSAPRWSAPRDSAPPSWRRQSERPYGARSEPDPAPRRCRARLANPVDRLVIVDSEHDPAAPDRLHSVPAATRSRSAPSKTRVEDCGSKGDQLAALAAVDVKYMIAKGKTPNTALPRSCSAECFSTNYQASLKKKANSLKVFGRNAGHTPSDDARIEIGRGGRALPKLPRGPIRSRVRELSKSIDARANRYDAVPMLR